MGSKRVGEVRSEESRRVRAVAVRTAKGGGGRDVYGLRIVAKKVDEGVGRFGVVVRSEVRS